MTLSESLFSICFSPATNGLVPAVMIGMQLLSSVSSQNKLYGCVSRKLNHFQDSMELETHIDVSTEWCVYTGHMCSGIFRQIANKKTEWTMQT